MNLLTATILVWIIACASQHTGTILVTTGLLVAVVLLTATYQTPERRFSDDIGCFT